MKDLKIITVEDLHKSIVSYILDSENIISDYEDMKNLILNMIKSGFMFSVDRDRLRDAMEDITYMLCPNDDANKDRVERGLDYGDSDSDDGEFMDYEEIRKHFQEGIKDIENKENKENKENEENNLNSDEEINSPKTDQGQE